MVSLCEVEQERPSKLNPFVEIHQPCIRTRQSCQLFPLYDIKTSALRSELTYSWLYSWGHILAFDNRILFTNNFDGFSHWLNNSLNFLIKFCFLPVICLPILVYLFRFISLIDLFTYNNFLSYYTINNYCNYCLFMEPYIIILIF